MWDEFVDAWGNTPLEEAIQHLEELISEDNFPNENCKEEHIALLDWLKELKKRQDNPNDYITDDFRERVASNTRTTNTAFTLGGRLAASMLRNGDWENLSPESRELFKDLLGAITC